jgi:ribonuclease P protein component
VAEKFYPLEGLGEEKSYQLRPLSSGLLFTFLQTIMKFSESLKKNREFREVYSKGRSFANKFLVMYITENDSKRNYLGISVSKKVGNSVVRHRITRLIRESYRLQEMIFNSGLNIVVVARASANGASYQEIEKALLHLGKLHRIIR